MGGIQRLWSAINRAILRSIATLPLSIIYALARAVASENSWCKPPRTEFTRTSALAAKGMMSEQFQTSPANFVAQQESSRFGGAARDQNVHT